MEDPLSSMSIEQLEEVLKRKRQAAKLVLLTPEEKEVKELEQLLQKKKTDLAIQQVREANALKHTTLSDIANEKVRDIVQKMRESMSLTYCKLESVMDSTLRMEKEVRTIYYTTRTEPLDDNDNVLFTKEEMLIIIRELVESTGDYTVAAIDLIHELKLGVGSYETSLMKMNYDRVHGLVVQEEKRRKIAHGKQDGCECTKGRCAKNMPGSSCKCLSGSGACSSKCKCKGDPSQCDNPNNAAASSAAASSLTSLSLNRG